MCRLGGMPGGPGEDAGRAELRKPFVAPSRRGRPPRETPQNARRSEDATATVRNLFESGILPGSPRRSIRRRGSNPRRRTRASVDPEGRTGRYDKFPEGRTERYDQSAEARGARNADADAKPTRVKSARSQWVPETHSRNG